MDREIKFRVWDTINSRMVYDPYRFEVKPDCYDNPEPFRFYEDWQDVEDGIARLCYVMQFTGLKDKKGKEIYEGDMVIRTAKVIEGNKIGLTKKLRQAVQYRVIFHDGAFMLRKSHSKPPITLRSATVHFNEIEIIGNIYENPAKQLN